MVASTARADPPWTPPQSIATGLAANPAVALDGAGDAFAVWTGVQSGVRSPRPVLGVGLRPAGADWLAPAALSTDAIYPAVAAASTGDAIAVWQGVLAPRRVYADRWRPGLGWAAGQALSPGPGSNAAVAINAGGEAIAAWVRSRAGGARGGRAAGVQVAIAPVGGAFAGPVSISPSDDAVSPQVAINALGDAVVAWQAGSRRHCVVRAAFAYVGGGFGVPHTVSDNHASCQAVPQVAIDTLGNAIVVWTGRRGAHRSQAQTMERAAIGQWGARTTLARGISDPPRLAEDAAGDAVVVFSRRLRHGAVVEAALRPAGQPWQTVTLPGGGGALPQVAIDQRGDAIAIWDRGGTLLAAARPAGAQWSALSPVAGNLSLAGAPVVTLDARGNALVVWRERGALRSSSRPGLFAPPISTSGLIGQ